MLYLVGQHAACYHCRDFKCYSQHALIGALRVTNRMLLSGGAEFTPEHRQLDRAWLRWSGARAPHVVLLPVAVPDHLLVMVRTARRYFQPIGVQLEVARAYASGESSADSATQRPLNDALEGAHVLYLPDGSPISALAALRAGRTAALTYRALTTGVGLVACGASAMALCDFMWNGSGWETGLGLLRGMAVLPHHEKIAARYGGSASERFRQGLGDSTVVVGIDDATGLLLEWPNGRQDDSDPNHATAAQGQAIGSDAVTLYWPGEVRTYTDGQTFPLPAVHLFETLY